MLIMTYTKQSAVVNSGFDVARHCRVEFCSDKVHVCVLLRSETGDSVLGDYVRPNLGGDFVREILSVDSVQGGLCPDTSYSRQRQLRE